METTWTLQRSGRAEMPAIRRIHADDALDALQLGWRDFLASPTQLIFLAILYPAIGLVTARAMAGGALMPLLWPMISGFALIGPFAAIGVYELSRRRERGLSSSWQHALDVRHSLALPSILALGLLLMVLFGLWLLVAQGIYGATLGAMAGTPLPTDLLSLAHRVFITPEGRWLLLLGHGAGLVFAIIVLMLTVVAFPLLLDRAAEGHPVDAATAIRTSIRAVAANPLPMALWGLIVAGCLALGSLPLFVGLAVALPVLGHGTWHLYRKVVAR